MVRQAHHVPEYIAIGKIGAPWGLKGEVKLQLYNTQSQIFKKTRFVYLKAGFAFQKLKLVNFKSQGKFFLIRLENYSSLEELKALGGLEIFVSTDQLMPKQKGEFYIYELIGMQVFDEQDQRIGELKAVENYGSADLLKIHSQDKENPKEYLIPWIPELIMKVDEEAMKIVIRRMEGLL